TPIATQDDEKDERQRRDNEHAPDHLHTRIDFAPLPHDIPHSAKPARLHDEEPVDEGHRAREEDDQCREPPAVESLRQAEPHLGKEPGDSTVVADPVAEEAESDDDERPAQELKRLELRHVLEVTIRVAAKERLETRLADPLHAKEDEEERGRERVEPALEDERHGEEERADEDPEEDEGIRLRLGDEGDPAIDRGEDRNGDEHEHAASAAF